MPKENDINVDNNEKKDLKVNEEVNLDPKDNEVQVPKNGEENQLDEEKKKELAALNAKEEEKNKENPEENKESEKKEEKEEAKKDGEEKKEEGEKESLQEGKIKEGASPEKKKTGSLGEQEGDSFNLEMLRDNPKLAKRLATTIDKEGRMGSVFQEEEDAEYEFRKDPEKAMERIQDLASRGKLFLRERGKDTFHKLEKDSEGGYKLGEGFAQKSSPPYDYAYGLLIQMTAGFFKLSFGKNWFSDRAERFRSWLKMDISIDEEKQEIQDEREQAKSDEKKAKKKQEKAEKRRLKKLAKEEKKKQKQEQKEKQKQEKKNKKAEKQGKDTPGKQEEKDNRMLGDTPPLEEKLGPGAEHQAPSKEKARPSMQPHRPLVQEKLFLDQDLKREEERWMETKDWKERTRNLLFKEKSQEVIREMNGIDKSRDDDLIGCIAGLLGRGAGEKQNSQEQKQRQNILDRLLNSGTEMSSEFDMQLNLGLSAFKDAKQALRNNNKEPMQKLLHDTVVELSKAASSGTELSERNQIIGRYITETMRFAKENNLDIGLSKKELTAAKGAVEMGNIATKGTMARQSLGKQENLDLNDPTTQNVLNDYMTMKSVEAGMRVGGKKGNYSDIQLIVGSTGSNQFYGLVRNSSDMRGLLSDPEGAKTVTNMVEKPHGMVADLKGHQMMSESLDKIISAKSAKPDDPQLHLQKQKENINVKTA